ncbi:MAG: selenocysteine-specific translation elongation factor [Acidimicrobiia bacterium]|nr:selenocysteine-specific translation elongation factor [Acidimicrobiia bacterium]
MPVVGTAGHVDHGKSTLVQALTGRDPDRWTEEKERGLTIDLGFAWTTLPSGTEVSFVDVPGHERFIKNMLAGTDGFDVALFVVAADEGWMPQSEEHLAVLDLLGIERAVVALTKVDRVDDELAELATLDVTEHLEGTKLEAAPVIPVSAVTGSGIAELQAALDAQVAAGGAPPDGRPRLWVDRSFTISGAGTVVTGTLTGGPLHVGDQIVIHPGHREGRVRGLQSHEHSRDTAEPGSRVAVNVVGLDRSEVGRGSMLGRADDWMPSDRLLVSFHRARYIDEPLTNRGAYHLHLGSGAWPVRLRSSGTAAVGSEVAVLHASEAIPTATGDRFILREVGRRAIVAGGNVLMPDAPRRSADAAAAADAIIAAIAGGPDAVADAMVEIHRFADLARISAHTGGGMPRSAIIAGRTALSRPIAASLTSRATNLISEYHGANPLRPGMPIASLASTLDVPQETLNALLTDTASLRVDGSVIALASFATGLTDAQEAAFAGVRAALLDAGFNVPRTKDLGLGDELIHALFRAERLVRVSEDFAYLPEQIDQLFEQLTELPDPFTVAEFRDTYGISRKYAVPLLEWLDRLNATVRRGDVRTVRS